MIVRAIALKNASATGTACACTGAGQGTVVDLGSRACDVVLYAGLQVLSSTFSTCALYPLLQANSSSGYTALNTGTDVYSFGCQTCRGSALVRIPWNCASATSTNRTFLRAAWSQSCNATVKWLLAADVDTVRP